MGVFPLGRTETVYPREAFAPAMCEGYWDARRQRRDSYEELSEVDLEETEEILEPKVMLPPPPAALPKRRPATLLR